MISSGGGPLTHTKTTSIGGYAYKANATGNTNYTLNSTGVSHTLAVIYPPPEYSISTSIPSTWYRNAFALFNITWTDANDPNGFSAAFIQLNHTGTATNYTMTRRPDTTISTYELNLTKPMGLAWRVYANNSLNTWNATPLTHTTISKITPTLSLTVSPSWRVIKGTQTIVTCASNQVTPILYRDGVVVSSPDIQTLGTGDYVYVCNNTATVNYSSVSESSILYVFRYTGDILIVQSESLISVQQGSNASTVVVVKNTGNASQAVTFSVENITSTWYTINATSITLDVDEQVAFLINFTIDESTEVKDYTGQYKASTVNKTLTPDFVLRVLPKNETQSDISVDLALYRANMTSIWNEINESKTLDVNVTLAEEKILEAKEKIDLAESYIENGDYFSAYQLFDDIHALISDAETELEAALTEAGYERGEGWPKWLIWAIVGAAIAIVGVIAYLLWPQAGYSPRAGRYTHKTPKERSIEAIAGAKEKVVSKIPKPKPLSKPEPAYEPSPEALKRAGIEIEPVKRGRYTIPKPKTVQQKISETASKIKDLFKRKRKYEEVEIKEIK